MLSSYYEMLKSCWSCIISITFLYQLNVISNTKCFVYNNRIQCPASTGSWYIYCILHFTLSTLGLIYGFQLTVPARVTYLQDKCMSRAIEITSPRTTTIILGYVRNLMFWDKFTLDLCVFYCFKSTQCWN